MRIRRNLAANLEKVDRFSVVRVRWIDAHNLEIGWTDLDDLKSRNLRCTIETVGFFVETRNEFVVICGDVGGPHDGDDEVILNGVACIPLACVQEIKVY